MFDDRLRDSKDQFLSKFFLRFWLKLSPNTISTIGFILGIICIILILQKLYLPALLFWILNRFMDGIDGLVARKTGKQSEFGAYLDIVYDFAIYSLFIFALILVNIHIDEVVVAGVLLLCLYYVNSVSWAFLSLLIEKRKTGGTLLSIDIAFPPALVEKSETIIFYIFFLLFSALAPPDLVNQFQWLTILFLLFGGLILLSIIQRLLLARTIFTTQISVIDPDELENADI